MVIIKERHTNLDFEERKDESDIYELVGLISSIDKKIYDSLFSFFGYNNSVLAGSDRYLPKKIFISIYMTFCLHLNSVYIKKRLEFNKNFNRYFLLIYYI